MHLTPQLATSMTTVTHSTTSCMPTATKRRNFDASSLKLKMDPQVFLGGPGHPFLARYPPPESNPNTELHKDPNDSGSWTGDHRPRKLEAVAVNEHEITALFDRTE